MQPTINALEDAVEVSAVSRAPPAASACTECWSLRRLLGGVEGRCLLPLGSCSVLAAAVPRSERASCVMKDTGLEYPS